MTYIPVTHKFVVVINKKVPVGNAMNAIGHLAAGLPFNDFTSTMTEGTYAEQQERTAQTAEADLEYWGVCAFGEIEKLNSLTKKFSLWR